MFWIELSMESLCMCVKHHESEKKMFESPLLRPTQVLQPKLHEKQCPLNVFRFERVPDIL
jgi:hypothetical protein